MSASPLSGGEGPIGERPLVSIGLPTYNRPELLARALETLISQTWENIEIIVSDNASPNPAVQEVLRGFSDRDRRIRVITHQEGIGVVSNFLFVLQQARGPYFMWAADDDEWSDDFVSLLMGTIGTAALAMSDYETVFHSSSTTAQTKMPGLDASDRHFHRAEKFLGNMQPSLVYGIYRTNALRECVPMRYFDFWDCALVFTVLMRHGVNTVPGFKYRAGVHSEEYEIKLASPEKKRLAYLDFAKIMFRETWSVSGPTFLERARITLRIIKTLYTLRKHLTPLVRKQMKKQKA